MNPQQLSALAADLGFPPGLWHDGRDGLRADWADGALARLCWERNGTMTDDPWLSLDPSAKRGRLTEPEGSGGTPDYEIYADGSWESFDAWSDNSRPQKMAWPAWVRGAVGRVMGRVRCLLCGLSLSQHPAAAHTPDACGHLCGPCLARVQGEAPTPRSWPHGKRICAVCRAKCADATPMFEGPGGRLCLACARGMQTIRG